MNSFLLENLKKLYPDSYEMVYSGLQKLIDDFKRKNNLTNQSRKKETPFSEKDVVLICYPDHIQENGDQDENNQLNHGRDRVGHLTTLHCFLKKYAKGLFNKVHLLPFYPYSSDDGFSVIDYYQVRKDLGSWDNIKELTKDFDLIFDFVLNHISSQSSWFQGFLKGDQRYENFFLTFEKPIDTSKIYHPRATPILTPFDRSGRDRLVWTSFSSDQIDLNYQNPMVFLEMVKVFLFYLQQGASGLRLDAVRLIWKKLGTACVDLPETHLLIKTFRQILEIVGLKNLLLAEVKGSFETAYSYFGQGDEADLIYNFELAPLILYIFLKGDVSFLYTFLKKIKKPPTLNNAYFNITATHDGIGLTPLVNVVGEKEINWLVEKAKGRGGLVKEHLVNNQLKPYELNITYFDALGGMAPFLASQAIQLSLAGVPGIYLNSLIGGQNWIDGVKQTGESRTINREKFSYQKLVSELEDRNSTKNQVYTQYKNLIHTRINESLFNPEIEQEAVDLHPKVFAILRFAENKSLLSLVNVSGQKIAIENQKLINIIKKEKVKDLISNNDFHLKNSNFLVLNPYQYLWLK